MSRTAPRRRILAPAAALVAALALAGCSQIDALAPVSGGPLQTVRVGVLDVLVQADVPILVAPVCTQEETQFTCVGSTIDGAEIMAESTLTKPYMISVAVGSEVLYEGDVQVILDGAAQVTP